jgi:hypothetical protein
MSLDISLQSTTYQVANRQWLLSEPDVKLNVTLDISLFVASATNEVQTVTITGTPTGGTFTLTYGGQTTAGIAYNAAASAVQSALVALSSVGAGNVAVTGGPGPGTAWTVTFQGTLAGTNVAQMTTSGASLTGGSSPASAVTTATGGVVAHYPNGYIPSGTVIGKVTSGGLFGPYDDNASDGRQTAYGITYGDVRAVRQNGTTATKVSTGAVVSDAIIASSKLPFQAGPGSIDANGKTDLAQLRFEA